MIKGRYYKTSKIKVKLNNYYNAFYSSVNENSIFRCHHQILPLRDISLTTNILFRNKSVTFTYVWRKDRFPRLLCKIKYEYKNVI